MSRFPAINYKNTNLIHKDTIMILSLSNLGDARDILISLVMLRELYEPNNPLRWLFILILYRLISFNH